MEDGSASSDERHTEAGIAQDPGCRGGAGLHAPINGFGAAHGGFISTLADLWASYSVAPRLDPAARLATSSLAAAFLSRVVAGDWLPSEVDRVRIGRRLCGRLAIVRERWPVALARALFSWVGE